MEIEQREDVLSPGSITVFVGVTFETPLTSLGHALSLNACPITHDRRRPAEAAHPRLPDSPRQIYSFPPDRFSHFGCFFFFPHQQHDCSSHDDARSKYQRRIRYKNTQAKSANGEASSRGVWCFYRSTYLTCLSNHILSSKK